MMFLLCSCGKWEDFFIGAEDVAGTYTGFLEGINVENEAGLKNRDSQIIIDFDLLHDLHVEPEGDVIVFISSKFIPRFRAIVAGIGNSAMNYEFVSFEGFDPIKKKSFDAISIQQIIFQKRNGYWIVVLQLVRVGLESEDGDPKGINVYQYFSYPPEIAATMTESVAIQYVNGLFGLLSDVQRMSLF